MFTYLRKSKLIIGITRLVVGWSLAQVLGFSSPAAEAPTSGVANGTNGTLWLIPHTHWEGAVFKTREEYLDMGLPNLLTAVRLLKEHPNYRFALDQLAYFKPFIERYPEEAAAFRQFVADGRLQIVGGLNVMPDDNMPSGESFVRQMLYAKGYVREVLGVEVKVGWLLDTFGHHAQLPQLLRLGGYASFWFSRGVEDRAKMPSEFLWQGIDGTRIPAFWLPFSYGHLYGPPKELAPFTQFMKRRYQALEPFSRGSRDRVGLAGVDVSEPELHVPALVEEFNRQPNPPFALRIGVPTDFEAVVAKRADLPVITGERNPLFQGIYSTRIELKQRMREAERLLTTAEKFGASAKWLGAQVDDRMLWRAWDNALFNITHDLCSGVMTDFVYTDTLRSYDFSLRIAEEMLESRIGEVLAHTDTRGEGIPLAVFNPLGWARTDAVSGDVGFAAGGIVDFDLLDAANKIVPAQLVGTERFEDGGLRRVQFTFVAHEVPAMGYTIYHVVARKSAGPTKSAVDDSGNGLLQNHFYRANVDLKTGALTGLNVVQGDWEALSGPGNVVAVEPDHGDVWELNQNLDGGQNLIMTRPLPVPQSPQAHFSTEETATNGVARRGPVFSEVEVAHPFGSNSFHTIVRLYQDLPRIDFTTTILNRDSFVRYRVLMPTSIKAGRNTQEIPFGSIERPLNQEFPAQNWMDCGDGRRGVALLNRAMPGNNDADGTLMLSLLRSTRIQSYGIGGGFEGQSSDSALELGKELTLHYALMPHAGDWREAAVCRAGLEFNNPMLVRKAAAHPGPLPARWGLLDVSPSNVLLSAIKLAKDGSTVIRVYETSGRATTGASIKLHTKILSAHEANLMEDSGAKLQVQADTVQFDLHPFEIKTFKLSLGQKMASK